MADINEVRVEESLRIKIGEAKNLPTKDTCCMVKLDQEEIFKTQTIEANSHPFYGEEFNCQVPRKFRFLSFYVCEKSQKQEKILGKVGLKKEELYSYHGKDHWFPLKPVDADSEVQGQVHVEVRHEECIHPTSTYSHKVTVRIIECQDLMIINGACNPYAAVTFTRGRKNKVDVKRTAVKKKTICPQFEETFVFDMERKSRNGDINNYKQDEGTNAELSVSIWHDDSRVSREVFGGMFPGTFLGEIKLPLQELEVNSTHRAWYLLQPRDSNKKVKQVLGSLRVKIQYTEDHVFKTHYYDDLRNLLFESPSVEPVTSSGAYILGEVASNKEDAAQPLVRIFLHYGKVVPLIKALTDWEIAKTSDPNTIFRGNTLASKCMDELMKLVGFHYLHDTLKGIIDKIYEERLPCEIDPTRLNEDDNLQTNMMNLQGYIEEIFQAIAYSGLSCPTTMCEVFYHLKEATVKRFPGNGDIRYQVVSGFIFLRFFAPAILGPTLFQLSTDVPDIMIKRTLTLISKAIQSLGNLLTSKIQGSGFKEDYMVPLFQNFTDQQHTEAIRMFLDIISSAKRAHSRAIEAPIVLKEGVMIKRAQGRRRFGLKNFKRRYFCLTNLSLSYAKKKGAPPLCVIPGENILATATLQEESFKMKYMFQVVQPQRTLYIQANNCVEEKEWIDILTKICRTNQNRLKEYHPAAYLNSHWLCCKAVEKEARGCRAVTGLPADIKINIDADREMERVHSLLLNNMEKLEKLQEKQLAGSDVSVSQEVYSAEESIVPSTEIEDTKTCFQTLNEMLRCVVSLEQEHMQYLKLLQKNMVYGSQDVPIGDSNYLHSLQRR